MDQGASSLTKDTNIQQCRGETRTDSKGYGHRKTRAQDVSKVFGIK